MSGPVASLLSNGSRLHLQHGPIDLVIGADSAHPAGRQLAFEAAALRFETILDELVRDLPLLRLQMMPDSAMPRGHTALRMDAAVRGHAGRAFVTPMAAVAGAVADEVLAAMVAQGQLRRAYVNNGGDIALHLAAGQSFISAMAGPNGADLGRIRIAAGTGIGGIATSGQGGRSLSFGIADSVTVLGRNAAVADVAATLIANAVNLADHPEIRRSPANELHPDSDLGSRRVVTCVGELSDQDIETALSRGARAAQRLLNEGQIIGACLSLRGSQRIVGATSAYLPSQTNRMEHV